ncbi:MAG: hypothetical protein CLLPBCKN_004894 [Chroococcidiopsis cubana SAG 39.79]|uniref:Uncharacterized protein n=1 Tax=Chroococcidiopsis cubana SAG 39.79 TaxID=388085 RepID=A0AB37UJI5_9CYAN|nr:hypothetical protein [Chroococcidiopsis cubana]MDZ4875498.1 hypothetical protein [Chroococcidiopsis cubana SAG 39.79]PSB64147.1 hypothetical protein C7B79_10935 [Chroococcidiopsis cubana CCALA 043]RUT11582.1 hypothetical protein DSM107010_30690 [Chroococcidiopsis cubana SAG 39.79]
MSKSKKETSGGDEANVSMSRTRVKPMGRVGTIQMEDIPPEQQHLYIQIGKRLYNKAGLSPEQLRKFDTQYVTAEGYQACEIKRQTFGGNVRVISDNVPSSDT